MPDSVSSYLPLGLLAAALALGCQRPTRAVVTRDAAADGARLAGADAGRPRSTDPCDILEPAQRTLMVARVGDQSLTLCDFARRVNNQNPYLRARFNSPEQRRTLLRSWLDAELLAAEAQSRGLDRDPSVRRAITMQLARRVEQQVRDAVPDPTITEAEVRAYYEAHRAEYQTDAQVRVSQIVVGTLAQAQRVLTELQAHPDDDGLFRTRVRELSVDPSSRAAEGDLAFFPRNGGATVEPEVAEAAFTLTRNGQILDRVVESAHGGANRGRGCHVLRLTARRDPLHRSLEDETRRIRARLLRERYEAAQEAAVQGLLTRLRAQTPVTIDEAALSAVHIESSPVPPAVPAAPARAPR